MAQDLKYFEFNDWNFLSKTVIFTSPFFSLFCLFGGEFELFLFSTFIFFLTISYATTTRIKFKKGEIEKTTSFFYIDLPAISNVYSKDKFDIVRISEYNENSSKGGGLYYGAQMFRFNFKIEDIYIILKSSKTKKNLKIAKINDYKEAKKVATLIADQWDYKVMDHRARRLKKEKVMREERLKTRGKW